MISTPHANRRHFLGMSFAAGALASSMGIARGGEIFPVVDTAQGKLRGMMSGGIAVFKGVRYGAPTSGRNRFMPPQPVEKWAGVRDALHYSDVAPQVPADRRFAYADLIMLDLQPGGPGEDLLAVNLWTPSLSATAKKPVIVVLHGGGFYGGSGNSTGMDGEQMARFTDSVVISVTHRLGAFGFLHLAEQGGADFGSSGTVGMQDIVAALAWVQENVAMFGGDPSRVLVFGQSGGGAKTSTLMAMPAAKGLFHRAGVMSGSALRMMPAEMASANAARLIRALEIHPKDIRKLQDIPYQQLLETQAKLEAADRARGEAPGAFAPVVDGIALPRHPFDPDAPDVSRDVPMVISTALDERAYRMTHFNMTEAELVKHAKSRAGERAEEAISLYRDEDKAATPFLLAARMDSDRSYRISAAKQADRKYQQGGASVWSYLWTWPSPAFGGRYGAVHGIDVAPSLHNIRGALNGPSTQSVAMADRIASMWGAFAAHGNPNNDRLPNWPSYDDQSRQTLVLDNHTRVESDPRGKHRSFWESLGPQAPLAG
jgi:para-nitrobenzyl esterase